MHTFSMRILGVCILFVSLTSGIIDLNQLFNYANQPVPAYITKDNTPANNTLNDRIATLGRVLFYDKTLSSNQEISCASCHHQAFAFTDTALVSRGAFGTTERHSMRLVNARFSEETHFFWDERAGSLEAQVLEPIHDEIEMGYSGQNGQPNFDSLIQRLHKTSYFDTLYAFAFGSTTPVTKERIAAALAQFIRSMQSFDTKYDAGRAQVSSDTIPFPNFTANENEGKRLYFTLPALGGAGCFRCHQAPEFSIDPHTRNNGVILKANSFTELDLHNTRAPSLRELRNPEGKWNGPFMHNGAFRNLSDAVNHYVYLHNNPLNTNLDLRLDSATQDITLSKPAKATLIQFLLTLSGKQIYTHEKWANPFEADGSLEITPLFSHVGQPALPDEISVYPNPFSSKTTISVPPNAHISWQLYHAQTGQVIMHGASTSTQIDLNISHAPSGLLLLRLYDTRTKHVQVKKLVHLGAE